jgi:exodeoxyribonuclease III
VLREIVAAMPVYRTYLDDIALDPEDRRNIALAVAKAREATPAIDPAVFDFLNDILTGEFCRRAAPIGRGRLAPYKDDFGREPNVCREVVLVPVEDLRLTKIATFNVNGVNGRLPVLLRWLEMTSPDIACLQELKTSDEKFPAQAIAEAGYHAIWHGQKSYNGVAILSKGGPPAERRRGLPGDPDDTHSRYLEAEIGDLIIGCLYLPNGNPAPGTKFDYKLRWFERLRSYARLLMKKHDRVILCGDFNVVPTPIDAVVPQRWINDAVYFPESRAAYTQMLSDGWVDAIRRVHPQKGVYTYWNFGYGGSYDRSSGLRMDHLLLTPTLGDVLGEAGVDVETRGWEKPSDHAPAWIQINR